MQRTTLDIQKAYSIRSDGFSPRMASSTPYVGISLLFYELGVRIITMARVARASGFLN